MSGILEGVKVVSMELMEATPAATCWLGDWGADVIKIEPLTGDQFRGTRRIGGRSVFLNIDGAEVNPRFELLNRNKKRVNQRMSRHLTNPGVQPPLQCHQRG